MCHMAQVPVLPYLVQHYGAGGRTYGALMTMFGIMQFLGGLLAGPSPPSSLSVMT